MLINAPSQPERSALAGNAPSLLGHLKRIGFRRIEASFGLVITLVIVILNITFYFRGGALWRDEVSGVNLASLPSLLDIWRNNDYNSCPIVFDSLVHSWIYYGPGGGDGSLRFLGLLIGLGAIGMYWWSARSAGVNVPWMLLTVFGLSPNMILYGSEVRAYGLGVVTELLMLITFNRFVRQPTWPRGLAAGGAGLLAVQTLFANSFMLAAAAMAWGMVCLWQKRWKALGGLVLISLVCALSVLPYYFYTFHKNMQWTDITQFDISWALLASRFNKALNQAGPGFYLYWYFLLAAALIFYLWQLTKKSPGSSEQCKDLIGWCLLSTLLGLIFLFCYFKFLGGWTSHWYFLPALALTAYCMDLGLDHFVGEKLVWQISRFVLALFLAISCLHNGWSERSFRLSGLDIIADTIERNCAPQDLVVVTLWSNACAFNRYYRGKAAWISIPDIPDKRWQHPLHFRQFMLQADPIKKEIQRIEDTLKTGHRVWFVGGMARPKANEMPGSLPNDPHLAKPKEWNDVVYRETWTATILYKLVAHRCQFEEIVLPKDVTQGIFSQPLVRVQGWE